MKFLYQYRTRDNTLHEGVMSAPSRDDVYAVLKEKGIRPFRVEEAPGFFNKLLGKGKRWMAIAILAFLAIGSVTYAFMAKKTVEQIANTMHKEVLQPTDRHQIYGDPARMQELESQGYATVFSHEGDRFLARFAQPGTVVVLPSKSWREDMAKSLANVLETEISFSESEPGEVRELKQIVAGMREELKSYLANGVGTCETCVKRIEERQVRENQIYIQAKNELAKETDPDVYDERNAALRRLGLPTVSMPE